MFLRKKKIFLNSSSFSLDLNIFSIVASVLLNIIQTKIFNTDATRGPLMISWLGSYACNANCRFCSSNEMNKTQPNNISLERAIEIAHEIGKAKTKIVGLMGGEPFVWPHLFEVIKVLTKYNVKTYIITNGLFLKENVEKIIKYKVDTVVVSIDSNNPKEHDDNRRVPGIYDKAIEGIEYLKTQRTGRRPIIKSTTVVSRKNIKNINNIINHLSKIVDSTSVQPVTTGYISNPHEIPKEEKESFIFSQNEKKEVEREMEKVIKSHSEYNNFYYKNIPTYWFSLEKLLKVKCWSPFFRLIITPTGKVVHCTANPRFGSVGNIVDTPLMEIWNSGKMKRQREIIRQNKNNCICWTQDVSFNAFLHKIPLISRIPIFNKKNIISE